MKHLLRLLLSIFVTLSFPSETGGNGCQRHVITHQVERFRGRTFAVTSLPRCPHLLTRIAYTGSLESIREVKERLKGEAQVVSTGSFYAPRHKSKENGKRTKVDKLVDYCQKPGRVICPFRLGRWILVAKPTGELSIVPPEAKIDPGDTAVALGKRIIPDHADGFKASFDRRIAERMAIGLAKDNVHIVRAKTDLKTLAAYMRKLGCQEAIISDGGHTVHGKGLAHLYFRIIEPDPASTIGGV